jgi:predicted pyridoxine 5'-phosphate oxidase superfamily flavin-nucleotide-binding protein
MQAREYTSDVAFTPAVKAVQERKGSRKSYARMERSGGWATDVTPDLAGFLAGLDMFYLGTANADGQPYIQYRGGNPGFLKALDDHTLAFADFGGNVSNGATGAATVNLRGLGSQRTLVLVNNRRLMPGDPTQNGAASPDLNQIPAALIQRVDVLTGGASAVYGADAVAGVVNFIMNDKFEGVRVDAQYGLYPHDNNDSTSRNLVRDAGFNAPSGSETDGYSRDITFLAGINTEDGRGNATVYIGNGMGGESNPSWAPRADTLFKQEVPDLAIVVGTEPLVTPIYTVGTWRDVNSPKRPAQILMEMSALNITPYDYDQGFIGRYPPTRSEP